VPQNPDDETASELLKKIKAEKAKADKKEKPLPEIKAVEIPFKIPKNWEWCRLGEICLKIGSGSTPKGSNYSKSGFPFFRSQNVYNNGLVYDDITFISGEVQKQMKGTVVLPNDILLNITGGSMGRCAIVPMDFKEGNVSQHVCIIRPIKIANKFLHNCILSPTFQTFIFHSTTGAGREGLPKYNLEQFLFPLPPLSEQHRIVTKIDELMTLCDELETSVKNNQEYTQLLYQTALKEALQPKENVKICTETA
jgi:type I restriction enzyme S subunit